MTNAVLIDAAEVAQILDVSKAFAYKVVRELNEELKNKGFINYNNQCIIYNVDNGQATTWTPTVEDIFSNDWEIVN